MKKASDMLARVSAMRRWSCCCSSFMILSMLWMVIRKDGQIRWVDDFGHLETSQWGEEHRLFYVFLKDITDTITTAEQEKLIHSNRFYRDHGLPAV